MAKKVRLTAGRMATFWNEIQSSRRFQVIRDFRSVTLGKTWLHRIKAELQREAHCRIVQNP